MNSNNPAANLFSNKYISTSLMLIFGLYIGKTRYGMSTQTALIIALVTVFIYIPFLHFTSYTMSQKQIAYDTKKAEEKKRAQISGKKLVPGFLEEFSLKNVLIFILLIPVGVLLFGGAAFLFIYLLGLLF
jgi:hypothetical protein